MGKALDSWTVLPHGPFERWSDDVLSVTGELTMPLALLERRMTIVRLRSGQLVIFSALALDETRMRELEAFGRPAFLVIPNHLHRNDARIWKARYPEMVVVAPPGSKEAAEEIVPVDTLSPIFGDDRLRFVVVPGTAEREAALVFDEASGTTLILNDIVGNMPRRAGWFLRAMAFAGSEPRIPRPIRWLLIKDKAALRAQLETWAALPVARILVSHGAPIVDDARGVLRKLAATL